MTKVSSTTRHGQRRSGHAALIWMVMFPMAIGCIWGSISDETKWEMRLACRGWWRGDVHEVALFELGGVQRRVTVRSPRLCSSAAERDYAMAVLLVEDGQLSRAAELAWTLLGTSRDVDARELTGIVYARQGMHWASLQLLRSLHAEKPDSTTVRQSLVWALAQDRRTVDEAVAMAWQSAGDKADWPFANMLAGIRRRQFWSMLERVLLVCGASTLLLAGCWAMVRMLSEGDRFRLVWSADSQQHQEHAIGNRPVGAPVSGPRRPPSPKHGIDVESVVWHTVNLLQLAKLSVTLSAVKSVIDSAARSETEFFDIRWRRRSDCFRCLHVIDRTVAKDVRQYETLGFWQQRFTALNTSSRAALMHRIHDALDDVGVAPIYAHYAKRWRQEERRGLQ